jgi:hypothetical protein
MFKRNEKVEKRKIKVIISTSNALIRREFGRAMLLVCDGRGAFIDGF